MHWFGVLLLTSWTYASAMDLVPECYSYYEMFNAEGLTYEEVGQIADQMHEKNCWPTLQGLLETEQIPELPPITDCDSLVPHIVQMTVDQATVDSPAMMKLSSIERLNRQADCLKLLMPSALTSEAKASSEEYCANKVEGIVLDCTGTARFPNGKPLVRFYLERDPDGDEFVGYSSSR